MPSLESRGSMVVASILTLGFAAYILLHYVDPHLSITWSYAHLHRRSFLPWIGAGLIVLLPIAAATAWRSPSAHLPVGTLSRVQIGAGFLLLCAVLLAVTRWFPQVPHAVDSVEFMIGATRPGFRFNPRWYLSIRLYRLFAWPLVPPLEPETFARGANALLGAVALCALAGTARLLSRTRGEAIALTALVWSSFGVLQMSVGYLDIYPVPLATTGVYLWLAFRVLDGRTPLLWPLLIVFVGPFFYIGMILLAPSALFLAFAVFRRDGFHAVWVPCAISLAAAIFATVPGHGRPLAWADWYAEAAEAASCGWGYSSASCLLPFDYMTSWTHLNEMLHLLLLVDGIGLLLLVVCTFSELALDWRRIDLRLLILATIGAAHFAFLIVLDPLFGQYSDWDAYTYPGVAITLLGGYGFILWGRRVPGLFGPLLGLALAAASVHALARLNAMHVGYREHLIETPCHVNCGPPGSYYETCRNCIWDGSIVGCECLTDAGEWRKSRLSGHCRGDIRNDDGVLRCK